MLQPGTERKTAGAVAPRGDLKVFRPENPYIALGLAVNHLMTKPAFANLRFGDWSRILTGQINRKHYYFAVDSKNQSQGFMGWAVTSKEKAEAWVEGRGGLSFEDSLEGNCLILNARVRRRVVEIGNRFHDVKLQHVAPIGLPAADVLSKVIAAGMVNPA